MELQILKSDKLGRDVLSRRKRNRIMKGKLTVSLFLDNASPFELSVHRLTPESGQEPPADRQGLMSDTAIAQISERRAKALGQTFYGWAELSVEDAEQDGRIVRPTPTSEDASHADIVLPAETRQNERIRRKHAQKLAEAVQWRPRPDL